MACIAHPSVLFPFLEEINATPRKSLSQNFLIDANMIRKIADAACIKEGDTVLEIGPGPGALTQELLKRKAIVFAVEKDHRFAEALNRLQTEDNRLHIYETDILSFPLQREFAHLGPLKVVANLPYHITTPILELLCQQYHLFSLALVMVQKEMAQRITAKAQSKEMGSFTIFLQTYGTPSLAVNVSRNCFYPAPQVDSSVVKLEFHPPKISNTQEFHTFVRRAYQQRRKMLRSTLSIQGRYSNQRPEELSFEDWIELFHSAHTILSTQFSL